MDRELKQLLDEICQFHGLEDLDYNLFNKIHGNLQPNSSVEIHWVGRDNPDKGYVFILPHQTADEWDLCIHVPFMDNSDGIGEGDSAHKHLYFIVELEDVKEIVVKD